jgi:hypothetical protein
VHWYLAVSWQSTYHRSRATLTRLLTNRAVATTRDLRGALTAVERALSHISGGFPVKEIEPLARMWGRLQRKVARTVAARAGSRGATISKTRSLLSDCAGLRAFDASHPSRSASV